MARFHVNPSNGEPGVCRAEHQCKFGGDELHGPDAISARAAYENFVASGQDPSLTLLTPASKAENISPEAKMAQEEMKNVLTLLRHDTPVSRMANRVFGPNEAAQDAAYIVRNMIQSTNWAEVESVRATVRAVEQYAMQRRNECGSATDLLSRAENQARKTSDALCAAMGRIPDSLK